MRKELRLFFVPLIVGVILGVLEFVAFVSFQSVPKLPAALAVVLCVFVVAAGSVVARVKFGKPWLPLGWTFVVIFVIVVILSFSDFSPPPFLTSNAFLINTVLLVVFGIWLFIRTKRR